MSVLIKQEIARNSIGMLGELFKEWLKERQKAADEPITAYELAEFFEYVEKCIVNGR